MKKPNITWIKDWRISTIPSREVHVSKELIEIFNKFWEITNLDQKSKSTINRYSCAFHRLGGYLVEQSILEENMDKTSIELLLENVSSFEGPLIYHDNEQWQNEFDTVCRRLYKHLKN